MADDDGEMIMTITIAEVANGWAIYDERGLFSFSGGQRRAAPMLVARTSEELSSLVQRWADAKSKRSTG